MPTPTHATLGDLFGDIANKIRAKTGDSGTIVADNFPAKINEIETPILQSKSATPSLSAQTITPTSPNNGLSSVSISAITKELLASLDADFVAENIKKDVDLFGLIGALESGGGVQVATGSFTFAERTANITITNPIGKIPQYVIFYPAPIVDSSAAGVKLEILCSIATPTVQAYCRHHNVTANFSDRFNSNNMDWLADNGSNGTVVSGQFVSRMTANSFLLGDGTSSASASSGFGARTYYWVVIG